ncbi:MAG: calcium/sodium antiporter [Clostridia bacterium]|nr:calcium/sodium antiporter [Clostridia bacterium]
MAIFLNILLLLVGFVLLVKGADFFVDGASGIARLLGIPGFVIGLTVVAMGTSAPEAAVSITAGFAGSNELAISNVIGSNIFNLLVVAGTCAVIKPYKIENLLIKRDFPINIAASILLVVLMLIGRVLGYLNGIVLLAGIIAYIAYVVMDALKHRETFEEEETKKLSLPLSLVFIIGGLAAIIFGGNLVVDNATDIAERLGWSEAFIGLTIVAIGTSLPELVTSIVAARKGESGLALGNVIGSNLFNILFILGMSSVLCPISVDTDAIVNTIIMIGVTVAVFIPCFIKKGMGRVVGALSVLAYVAYTAYLLIFTI